MRHHLSIVLRLLFIIHARYLLEYCCCFCRFNVFSGLSGSCDKILSSLIVKCLMFVSIPISFPCLQIRLLTQTTTLPKTNRARPWKYVPKGNSSSNPSVSGAELLVLGRLCVTTVGSLCLAIHPLCFTRFRFARKLPPKLGYLLFGMIFFYGFYMVNHEKQLG